MLFDLRWVLFYKIIRMNNTKCPIVSVDIISLHYQDRSFTDAIVEIYFSSMHLCITNISLHISSLRVMQWQVKNTDNVSILKTIWHFQLFSTRDMLNDHKSPFYTNLAELMIVMTKYMKHKISTSRGLPLLLLKFTSTLFHFSLQNCVFKH